MENLSDKSFKYGENLTYIGDMNHLGGIKGAAMMTNNMIEVLKGAVLPIMDGVKKEEEPVFIRPGNLDGAAVTPPLVDPIYGTNPLVRGISNVVGFDVTKSQENEPPHVLTPTIQPTSQESSPTELQTFKDSNISTIQFDTLAQMEDRGIEEAIGTQLGKSQTPDNTPHILQTPEDFSRADEVSNPEPERTEPTVDIYVGLQIQVEEFRKNFLSSLDGLQRSIALLSKDINARCYELSRQVESARTQNITDNAAIVDAVRRGTEGIETLGQGQYLGR